MATGLARVESVSVALRASGEVVIAYVDQDAALQLATGDGETFRVRELVRGAAAAHVTVDSSGAVHLVYRDTGAHELVHARLDSGRSGRDTIDAARMAGELSAFAIDESDGLHVAYSVQHANADGSVDRYLRYAHAPRGGTFQVEDVDTSGNVAYGISLATQRGVPHIAYCNTRDGLRYATRASGAFVLQSPGGALGDVSETVLLLDATGLPFVVVQAHQPRPDVEVAHFDGHEWSVEILDGGGHLGDYLAAAMDSRATIHVAYVNRATGENNGLWYAHGRHRAWQREHLGSGGFGVALALDEHAAQHVVSYDLFRQSLVYFVFR